MQEPSGFAFKEFDDILVAPYSSLLQSPKGKSDHEGGPIWPNWNYQQEVRFCRNRKPVDTRPTIPSRYQLSPTKKGFWCGPVCGHYGHYIADFSTRIPVYLQDLPSDSKLVFGVGYCDRDNLFNATPIFFRQILEWYGVRRDQVLFVSQPTHFAKIICTAQQEQLADVPPSKDYVELIHSISSRNLIYPRKSLNRVYVSRAGQKTGLIAGERYLEYFFQESGFVAVRPEHLSLREQLAIYAGAKVLLFAEGSAIHSLQLLGRLDTSIFVICRRQRKILKSILRSRCQNTRYISSPPRIIHGLRASGLPAPENGISIINPQKILRRLIQNKITLSDWDERAYQEVVKRDIASWIRYYSTTSYRHIPGTAGCILESLLSCGLDPREYSDELSLFPAERNRAS